MKVEAYAARTTVRRERERVGWSGAREKGKGDCGPARIWTRSNYKLVWKPNSFQFMTAAPVKVTTLEVRRNPSRCPLRDEELRNKLNR